MQMQHIINDVCVFEGKQADKSASHALLHLSLLEDSTSAGAVQCTEVEQVFVRHAVFAVQPRSNLYRKKACGV